MKSSPPQAKPPIAPPRPHQSTWHGETLQDPWHWLRDPAYPQVNDPEILSYIEAENEYYAAAMQPHSDLVTAIEQEMRGRIAEEDESVPQRQGDWLYWSAYQRGAEYRKYYRRPIAGGEAQLILDEPALAAGRDYFRVGAMSVSPDGRYLAFAVDDCGAERFTVRFYDLHSGEMLADEIPDSLGALLWSEDTASPALLYGRANAHWRTDTALLHYLGSDVAEDIVLYHERDSRFTLHLDKTADRRYITISSGDNETQEVRLFLASNPLAAPLVVLPRRTAHEYYVEHREGWLYILTNDSHANFRIATAKLDDTAFAEGADHSGASPLGAWLDYISASDDFYICGMSIFRTFFVLEGRAGGLDQIEVRPYHNPDSPPSSAVEKTPDIVALPSSEKSSAADSALDSTLDPALDSTAHTAFAASEESSSLSIAAHRLVFPEAAYRVALGDNREYHQSQLRINYDSMVTPATVYDYDLAAGRLYARKQQRIPSGHRPADYHCERIYVPARDGTSLPVSLLYRRDCKHPAPLHLYGYASYGHAIAPSFSTTRLSLVDRGMIAAIAHGRGGDDMGRAWYLAGKGYQRWNTFHDFIDIAKGLIERGYTGAGHIAAEGHSAGGQIMGVISNEAPQLWGAVVAGVPFVDVLNTMLDESLPLTPGEWSEWGNPIENKAAFDYIASYSPYDNLCAQDYPPMLVTAGLHDPRVTYWEAAKWVARLRAVRSNESLLLLRTEMGAGHSGKSGRWQALREVAEDYAFILTQLGVE